MSAAVWILVATAVLAVVAVAAAVVAVRAVHRLSERAGTLHPGVPQAPPVPAPLATAETRATPLEARAVVPHDEGAAAALAPRLVEGRVVVPPTRDQVVAAAMARPGVRLTILVHGLAHALRPESRDRIGALMRREYGRRRRTRLQAGRRAARAARPSPADESWLGS